MKLAVVDPTNRNGKLVANSVSECTRLHKREMMCIRWRPAAYKARLPGHELPELLIAQANRFAQDAGCAIAGGLRGHFRSFLATAGRLDAMIGSGQLSRFGFGCRIEVRRVKIILSSNADEREQRIAPGIGECRSHSLRRGYIGDRTHGPFRGDPLAGRMSKDSGEAKKPGIFVDCGGLDCCDLIPAKALADNVQTA